MRKYSTTTAAYYEVSQFLVRMSADFPFLRESGDLGDLEPSDENFDVFIHEYTHYWHNISTLAGVRSLATFLAISRVFSHTLASSADGRSSGSSSLDPKLQAKLARFAELSERHAGAVVPADSYDGLADVVAVSFPDGRPSSVCDDDSAKRVLLELDVHGDSTTLKTALLLGSRAIDESLAHLFENSIARVFRGEPLVAPEFPYRVVERIAERYLQTESTDHRCARLATLALLAPNPGPSLIIMMERCRDAVASGRSCEVEIDAISNELKTWFGKKIPDVKKTLCEFRNAYSGRSHLQSALEEVVETYTRALEMRAENPLVFVDIFYPELDLVGLAEHTRELFPSCDFVQERKGDADEVARDVIHTFREEPADGEPEVSTFFRILQAQTHYSQAHLQGKVFVRSAETDPEASRCPFYTCCDKHPRLNNAEACRKAPWTNYSTNAERLCWYATGVRLTLGPGVAAPAD